MKGKWRISLEVNSITFGVLSPIDTSKVFALSRDVQHRIASTTSAKDPKLLFPNHRDKSVKTKEPKLFNFNECILIQQTSSALLQSCNCLARINVAVDNSQFTKSHNSAFDLREPRTSWAFS